MWKRVQIILVNAILLATLIAPWIWSPAHADPTITEYSLPPVQGQLTGITTGPDGALWFTEGGFLGSSGVSKIGRMALDGSVIEYPLPSPNASPISITTGPDGALWFTESGVQRIGRITTSGNVTEFALATADSSAQPWHIVAAPDGALWFSEIGTRALGRITTSGDFTEYPFNNVVDRPAVGLTVGPDGALWFAGSGGFHVSRMATDGVETDYPLTINFDPYPDFSIRDIATGPDGALWFVANVGHIGRITTSGIVTWYNYNGRAVGNMTRGTDGALWYSITDSTTGYYSIGRTSISGFSTQYAIPTLNSYPQGVTAGPDGAMWFVEGFGNKIGRIASATPYIALTPSSNPAEPGSTVNYTAAVYGALGWPLANTTINFSVSGHNDVASTCLTGPTGTCSFTYTDSGSSGLDTVSAYADYDHNGILGGTEPFVSMTQKWTETTNVSLNPIIKVSDVGSSTTFTATAIDANLSNSPVENTIVRYNVSGSSNLSGSCITNTSGQCSFTYTGPQLPGADAIAIYADINNNGTQDTNEPTASASQAWMLPASSSGQVTGAGQAPGSGPQGKITFGFSAKNGSNGLAGTCHIVEPGGGTKVHCTDVTSMVINGNSATIFGNAKVDNVLTTYRIDVQSNSGAGTDIFQIQTASGYSAGGILSKGSIDIQP